MTVHVLGLGPTLKHYKPDGNLSIGCNDIFRTVRTDFLIVVSRLPVDRADVVRASRPRVLLSSMPQWQKHPRYEPIGPMMKWRQNRRNYPEKGVYYSNNTPFIACSYAFFHMKATQIVLWGVDFENHPLLTGEALEHTVTDFYGLNEELKVRGSEIFFGKSPGLLPLRPWK